MADYNQLFEEFQRDPAAFSKDPEKVKQFQEGYKLLLSGKTPEGYKTSQEFASLYDQWQKWAMSTPTGKQAVTDMVRNAQTERFVKRNKPFFDAILAGADLATSISQIQQSNKAVRELQRPSMPSPNVLDPQLNNAIAQAQRGSFEALRALEPAKQEIAQQRMADINTGRSISGGQAGAFGAYSTAASLRAQRAAQRLPQIGDTIKARQQQRADQLLGLRQGVLQQEFGNRMQIANANMGQYQQDVAAAAALGQAGRTNLRNTLGQLPEMLTRTAGGLLPVQEVWNDYGSRVEQDLASRMTRQNRLGGLSVTPQVRPFNGVNPIQPPMSLSEQLRQKRLRDLRTGTSNYQYQTNMPLPNLRENY